MTTDNSKISQIYHRLIIIQTNRLIIINSDCQAGDLQFKSGILPLLKHACGESDQLLYTLAKLLHQRWISGEHISHMSLPNANKAAHSGFETQMKSHQKSETGVSVAPKMDMCPTKFKKKD